MPAWVDDPFANSASASPVGGIDLTYTPGERAAGVPAVVTYPRGSALPLRFSPATPTPVDADDYEVRVGVPGLSGSYDTFDSLTGDDSVGELVASPTAEQTAAWSLVGTLRAELWRVAGDGAPYPEAIVRLDLQGTLCDG